MNETLDWTGARRLMPIKCRLHPNTVPNTGFRHSPHLSLDYVRGHGEASSHIQKISAIIGRLAFIMSQGPLRIGFVPEHFSTPLHFAQKYYGLHATLIPFPSGTGHMVTAIRAGEIDVAIGLTEGWIAGLGKETVESDDGGYRLVGTYVETPLCMSTPPPRIATWTGHSVHCCRASPDASPHGPFPRGCKRD